MIFNCDCVAWILAIAIVLCTIIFAYIYSRLNYFKRKGIPYVEPRFYHGNFTGNYYSDMKRLYHHFKTDTNPIFGFYLLFNPIIVVKNLDLIKLILIKEFQIFPERGFYSNKKVDALSGHLFNMDKEGWKQTRSQLSPTFTSGRMKHMFSTVSDITERLASALKENIEMNGDNEIEMKEFLARYGTDVIGNVAFGIECNSLKNPKAEFREFGRKAITNAVTNFVGRILRTNFPEIARFLKIRNQSVDVEKFCFQIVRETMENRANGNKRNDFMDLLLEMKKSKENPDGLEFEEIAAHTFVFFLAGFETTSTAMGFAMYELSINQKIQQKARDEIVSVLKKHDGKMTYECLEEMGYLENVINESLRMYPPVVELNRKCRKDYPIPDSNLVIEKGMRLIIPITYIQRDAEYFKDPDTFMPERFDKDEVKNRHPMSYLPFGEGPRNCIGLRFGKMQAKLGLAIILKNFILTPGEKLPIPIKYNENSLFRQSTTGLWIKLNKVEL